MVLVNLSTERQNMNYDAIREEMQAELDSPQTYMVNSPGAYIRDRLFQKGHAKEAVFLDRKSTRLNSSHVKRSRMPSSA